MLKKQTLEDKITDYLKKVAELAELERHILDCVPDQLWQRYNNIKQEIPSDNSVIQKELREGKTTIEHEGHKIVVYDRTKTAPSADFLETAKELGHLESLVELGVITGIKINEDQIQRLEPNLQAIYSNLVNTFKITSIRWPKKADE